MRDMEEDAFPLDLAAHRSTYAIAFKLDIVKDALALGVTQAARRAGLDKGMVSRWVGKQRLLEEARDRPSGGGRQRTRLGHPGRSPFFPGMERRLAQWLRDQLILRPTRAGVLRQARRLLVEGSGVPIATVGNKWYCGFCRRSRDRATLRTLPGPNGIILARPRVVRSTGGRKGDSLGDAVAPAPS